MTVTYRTRRTTVLSVLFTSFGELASLPGRLVASQRRRMLRDRTAEIFTDLIEHADDHILDDLGYTRADLHRMRSKLYE